MSADVLQIISIVAFSLAGLFLIIAAILFFKLNIRSVVDDLSGKKAERQIRELRELNQQANVNIRSLYQPSPGKGSVELGKSNTLSLETEKLQDVDDQTLRLQIDEDTDVLDVGTDLLEEGTTLLEEAETSLLEYDSAESELPGGYHLLVNEILIHTEERI